MKKLTIVLALTAFYTASAFAGQSAAVKIVKPAEELSNEIRGTRESVRPGAQTGTKITGAGVTIETSKDAAGTDPKAANSNVAQTGVDAHNSCPADSGIAKVTKREQNVIYASFGAGISGNACVTGFKAPDVVSVVAAADEAGLTTLKAQNHTDVSQASRAEVVQISEAMATAIAKKLDLRQDNNALDINDAKQRMRDMCTDKCDVTSPAICNVL